MFFRHIRHRWILLSGLEAAIYKKWKRLVPIMSFTTIIRQGFTKCSERRTTQHRRALSARSVCLPWWRTLNVAARFGIQNGELQIPDDAYPLLCANCCLRSVSPARSRLNYRIIKDWAGSNPFYASASNWSRRNTSWKFDAPWNKEDAWGINMVWRKYKLNATSRRILSLVSSLLRNPCRYLIYVA